MTVIAAIDDSTTARTVLNVARRFALLLAIPVEAIHVQEASSGEVAATTAQAANVPLHVRNGTIVAALQAEIRELGATVLVIGSRSDHSGATPAGHNAVEIVQSIDCTILVVPPNTVDRPLRRVVVAVEGNGESHGLRGLFEHLGNRTTPEVIALHVLEPHDLPVFSDSPVLEAEAFRRELMIRIARDVVGDPARVRLETRVGEAAAALREAAGELDVDLVVLAWHRDLSGGHGRIVREMLAGASVPLLLLPRASHRHRGGERGSSSDQRSIE